MHYRFYHYAEMLYLEYIFKSMKFIDYLLLNVKKFIILTRLMHQVVLLDMAITYVELY
jgi:hypothetical protein